MPARWYYRHDGAEFGPVALPQLAQLASSGQIQLNDWVREGESSPWQPLAKSPEVLAAVSAAPIAASARPAAPKPRTATPIASPAARKTPAVPPAVKPAAPRAKAAPAPPPPPASITPTVAAVAVATVAPVMQRTQRAHPKKKSSGATVGIALAGAGGVVVLIVVAVMASMSGSTTTASGSAPKKESKATASEVATQGAQTNMTAAIRNWRDAKVKGGLKGLVNFEIKSVNWSGASAGTDELDRPGRLVVELSITNISDAPVTFTSWRSAAKTGAWLVDNDLKHVANAKAGGQKLSIAAQKTIVESLEFATTSQDFSELRLVLPYLVFERSGQWGYFLDGSTLRGEAPAKPASTLAKVAPEVSPTSELAPQVEPIIIEAAPAPEASVNATPEDDEGNPKVDVRDLIKRSREMEQKPAAAKSE